MIRQATTGLLSDIGRRPGILTLGLYAYHKLACTQAAAYHPSQNVLFSFNGSFAKTDTPYRAVLLDAAGTLLVPSESTAKVYLRYALNFGGARPGQLSEQGILDNYRRAYSTPWKHSTIRYVGDARDFWRYIVRESTGLAKEEMFEQVYQYYARPEAWRLAPGAAQGLQRLKAAGVKMAVVSNFDTRLRPLLRGLGIAQYFDAIIVSAEVGCEKPNRCIFDTALEALGVRAEDAVHVGDDRRNDIWGARDAGVHAWLWGSDVRGFDDLVFRVLHKGRLEAWDPEDGYQCAHTAGSG